MIRCPKCAHEQANPVECEVCGLLFQKFTKVQDRRKEQIGSQEGTRSGGKGLMAKVALVISLMGATAALTYHFAGEQKIVRTAPSADPAVDAPAAVVRQTSSATAPAVQARWQKEGDPAVVRGSVIEHAKNATVSIETPWGKGSGFFITDTAVVTNKHVVAPDQNQVNEIRHKVEIGRRLISLEREKLDEIRAQLNRMGDGPTRQQLIIILQEREKELAKILPNQKEAEERLARIDRPGSHTDIKIFLADGSEFSASATRISHSRDLALLTVYSAKTAVLTPAPKNTMLHQGDKVYTVGNPVGLRNTVTSGIFSGYRQREDTSEVFLQTDAPINPGNSGGPLIDESGLVHGVNTMIIQNTQGIGFAIPIQTVFEEFSIFRPDG